MTATDFVDGTGTQLDGDDAAQLAAAIAVCNPAALLMSMVHVSGDLGLLDEFAAELESARQDLANAQNTTGVHYSSGSGTPALPLGAFPDSVSEKVRVRAAQLLRAESTAVLGVPDEVLFRRMASLCTASDVDAEFIPLLFEQAGFRIGQRCVPVTKSPPEDFDVIVVGAGIIGINAAVKLGDAGFRYRVFEARDEIGGTWSRNTYPGAAVDTPSHYYSYSFELNPDWSKYYPSGPEYLGYLERVVEKYDLNRHIELSTKVVSADWIEREQKWHVRTKSADGAITDHRAQALVTALGVLNAPNIPDVPGLDSFEGTVVHTAEWSDDIDVEGRRVVVLGTGCTSVQLVTNIVDKVGTLDVVVRTPHWIVPEKTVVNDVPQAERWAMRHLPFYQEWFRLRAYWLASDNLYPVPRIEPEWAKSHLSVSPVNDLVMQTSLRYLNESFPDRPDLIEKLTPDFRPYAKRIVKDPGFFQALRRENVNLHRAGFAEVHADGVTTTDGEFIAADVIILATGFKLEYASLIDITGREGQRLAELWEFGDDPRAYLGIQVPGFPNLFVTAGPNAAPNHGAGHNITSEEHVHYVVECLQYLVENDYASMDVENQAMVEYNQKVDAALDKTVWAHPGKDVTGYYRNSKGRAIVPCPWRLVDYWTMLREPDVENFTFTSRSATK